MQDARNIQVYGIPQSVTREAAAVCRSRLITAVRELLDDSELDEVEITVATAARVQDVKKQDQPWHALRAGGRRTGDELTTEERARQYVSRAPLYQFEFLVIPDEVRDSLLAALDLIHLRSSVFGAWNLKSIEPFPDTALNFYGEPGTGKTLAAHALAHYLGCPILAASYAQIESKFHGDGPKNVEAIFYAAERDGAVLFIDEADSLLSKRLTNVTQGSEQAIRGYLDLSLSGL